MHPSAFEMPKQLVLRADLISHYEGYYGQKEQSKVISRFEDETHYSAIPLYQVTFTDYLRGNYKLVDVKNPHNEKKESKQL